MAVLLIAVAGLQYRWNVQIRQATEVRMGAALESLMMKWHLNLYRELFTICIALGVGPDSGAHEHWIDYLSRYEEWRSAAKDAGSLEKLYSNPDVVSNIYIYEASQGAGGRLLVLDPGAHRIEQLSKPVELQALLGRLQQRSAKLQVALRAWELDDPHPTEVLPNQAPAPGNRPSKVITGWQFDQSIPAIVHPILHHRGTDVTADAPVDWLVVVLNLDTITRRIFPELTQRLFEGTHGLAYRLAVVSCGTTSHLLYSSDPSLVIRDTSGADSIMDIFGPPPESTEESFWQVANDKESPHGEELRRFSGPVWFPVFQTADTQHWMLFLKQRNGSMEASVAKVWQANLLTGAVMLLMLAASMFLLLIVSHRERTVAAMQLDFVTSISHELRTPLAAMLAAGQNLSDGYARDLSHYGALITAEARQLIDLVDQILLFATLNDGKKKYQLTAVAIDEVLEALRKTAFALLTTSGFQVDLQIEENLPCLLGNKQALVRCLRNLIENAAKYSRDHRWIRVSAQLEEPAHPETGIKITVADHGIGVPASELQHIFDPFYRGQHATAAQIHGSGLGLSVVKHIVNEMRGRISVSSKVGEGSVFALHLRTADNSTLTTTRQPRRC